MLAPTLTLNPGRLTAADLRCLTVRLRATVPPMHEDRLLAPDIAAARAMVLTGAFVDFVPDEIRLCR